MLNNASGFVVALPTSLSCQSVWVGVSCLLARTVDKEFYYCRSWPFLFLYLAMGSVSAYIKRSVPLCFLCVIPLETERNRHLCTIHIKIKCYLNTKIYLLLLVG